MCFLIFDSANKSCSLGSAQNSASRPQVFQISRAESGGYLLAKPLLESSEPLWEQKCEPIEDDQWLTLVITLLCSPTTQGHSEGARALI